MPDELHVRNQIPLVRKAVRMKFAINKEILSSNFLSYIELLYQEYKKGALE